MTWYEKKKSMRYMYTYSTVVHNKYCVPCIHHGVLQERIWTAKVFKQGVAEDVNNQHKARFLGLLTFQDRC